MRTQSQNPRTAGLARALRPLIVVVGLAGLLLGRWVAPVACQPATTLATEAPSVEPAGIVGPTAHTILR